MADVRTQQARERVALALTWAPHRPGKGGFADGIAALDDLADLVAALETALRQIDTRLTTLEGDNVTTSHAAAVHVRMIARDALEGDDAEPD